MPICYHKKRNSFLPFLIGLQLMMAAVAGLYAQDTTFALYKELALKYLRERDSNALPLTERFVEFARETKTDSVLAIAYHLHGLALRDAEQNMSAIPIFVKEQQLRTDMKDQEGLAEVNLSLGDAYRSIFDPATAASYLTEALSLFEKKGNASGVARTLNRQAALHIDFTFPPGLEQGYTLASQSLKLAEQIGDYDLQVNNLILIGAYYGKIRQEELALENLLRAESLISLAQQKHHLALIYENIAKIYQEAGNLEKAIVYNTLGYQDAVRSGTKVYEWLGAYFLGYDYLLANQPDSGYKYQAIGLQARVDIIDEVRVRQKAMMEEQFFTESYGRDIENQVKQKRLFFALLAISILSAVIILLLLYSRNRQLRSINRVLTERNDLILQQKAELTQLNTQKDRFYSIIAHDLRSPFNSILGLSGVLTDRLKDQGDPKLQNLAGNLHQSASKFYGFLENLLEWVQLQQGVLTNNPSLVNLAGLFDECHNTFRDSIQKKHIHFQAEASESLRVYADQAMLGSILRNLLSNAIKFTPEGGSITLTGHPSDSGRVEISIRDTGIGMDPALIDNLQGFGKSGSRPGTNGEPSSGIGLNICREFAEKMGGTIRIESEPGKGTLFTVTLPAKPPLA